MTECHFRGPCGCRPVEVSCLTISSVFKCVTKYVFLKIFKWINIHDSPSRNTVIIILSISFLDDRKQERTPSIHWAFCTTIKVLNTNVTNVEMFILTFKSSSTLCWQLTAVKIKSCRKTDFVWFNDKKPFFYRVCNLVLCPTDQNCIDSLVTVMSNIHH